MTSQRGQGSVELVLLAPLLLVFMFLIFEFGRVFGSWLMITNAAREGARKAITQNCDTFASDPVISGVIKDRVQETAQFLVVNDGACTGSYDSCIDVVRCDSTAPVDCPRPPNPEVIATITAVYKVYTLMPIIGDIPFIGPVNYPGYLPVVGRSSMRCE